MYEAKVEKLWALPPRWYWRVRQVDGYLTLKCGTALTRKGAVRKANRAARRLATQPKPTTWIVEV